MTNDEFREQCRALDPPCERRGKPLPQKVKCGCGGDRDKEVAVYRCPVFGACTLHATGKRNKINGKPVAVCLGCLSNPDGAT